MFTCACNHATAWLAPYVDCATSHSSHNLPGSRVVSVNDQEADFPQVDYYLPSLSPWALEIYRLLTKQYTINLDLGSTRQYTLNSSPISEKEGVSEVGKVSKRAFLLGCHCRAATITLSAAHTLRHHVCVSIEISRLVQPHSQII